MLLDIKKTPKKPQYTMAPEIPLVLQSCDFEELNFTCSSGNNFTLNSFFETMVIILFLMMFVALYYRCLANTETALGR